MPPRGCKEKKKNSKVTMGNKASSAETDGLPGAINDEEDPTIGSTEQSALLTDKSMLSSSSKADNDVPSHVHDPHWADKHPDYGSSPPPPSTPPDRQPTKNKNKNNHNNHNNKNNVVAASGEAGLEVRTDFLGNTRVHPEPGPACYFIFKFWFYLAALIAFGMIIVQMLTWWFLDETSLMQEVLRIYIIFICILFFLAELRIPLCCRERPPMQHWVYRGFIYTFVGVIAMEESEAALGNMQPINPGFPEYLASTVLVIAAYIMVVLGCIYMILGICFMENMWNRVRDNHEDRVLQAILESRGGDHSV